LAFRLPRRLFLKKRTPVIELQGQILITQGEVWSDGTTFSKDCRFVLPERPVPVFINFDREQRIGFCELIQQDNMLVGKMTLGGDIALAVEGKVIYSSGRNIERFSPTAVSIVPDIAIGYEIRPKEYFNKKDQRGNLI